MACVYQVQELVLCNEDLNRVLTGILIKGEPLYYSVENSLQTVGSILGKKVYYRVHLNPNLNV